ncbi:MAG: hypothetical protein WCG45_04655 [bacterium]
MKNKLCVLFGALLPTVGFAIVKQIDGGGPNIFSMGIIISTIILTTVILSQILILKNSKRNLI